MRAQGEVDRHRDLRSESLRLPRRGHGGFLFSQSDLLNIIPNLRLVMFGGLIVLFLVVEPEGLNRLWGNIRNYFRMWPFSY